MKQESILATRIYESRKNLGITQEILADKLGITPQSISRWENGQSRPDVDMLPKLAAIFGITIDGLFGYHAENLKIASYEKKFKNANTSNIFLDKYSELQLKILSAMPPDSPKNLLEIGCNDGQAAMFFARNGYIVSAFDISEKNIQKANQRAQDIGLKINFFCADILNYKINSKFDIIFSNGGVQFIPPADRARVFEIIKANTAVGGINAFSVAVDKNFVDSKSDYQSAEIFNYYGRNWKFEVMQEIYSHNDFCKDIMIARKIND